MAKIIACSSLVWVVSVVSMYVLLQSQNQKKMFHYMVVGGAIALIGLMVTYNVEPVFMTRR